MLAELRYLGNHLASLFAAFVVMAITMAIAIGEHLAFGPVLIVFVLIGSCALAGYFAFGVLKETRRSADEVVPVRQGARFMPLIIDALWIGLAGYQVATLAGALHRHEHIAMETLVWSGFLLIFFTVGGVRDARSRIQGATQR